MKKLVASRQTDTMLLEIEWCYSAVFHGWNWGLQGLLETSKESSGYPSSACAVRDNCVCYNFSGTTRSKAAKTQLAVTMKH